MTVRRCAVCRRPYPPQHVGRSTRAGRWYCAPRCFFDPRADPDWQAEVDVCPCTTCRTKRQERA